MAAMGEQERRVAALLMNAGSARHAETLLLTHAGRFDPYELVRELEDGQRRFEADGKTKAAALVGFYVSLARELSGVLQRIGSVARSGSAPVGFPDPQEDLGHPRLLLERQASELLGRGEFEAARDAFRQADELPLPHPDEWGRAAGLRMRLAEALGAKGRRREALGILDSVQLGPHGAEMGSESMLRIRFHRLRGILCQDEADYEQARSCYRTALEEAEGLHDHQAQFALRMLLAGAYFEAGRGREAVREYRRALGLAESRFGTEMRACALNRLGAAYQKAGDHAAARSSLRRALELVGGSSVNEGGARFEAEAWVGLGDLAADEGRMDDAVGAYFEALTKAMHLSKDIIAHGMALVASRLDRIDADHASVLLRTAQVFRDVVGSDPGRGWTFHLPFRLAEAAQRLGCGQVTEAVSALRVLREESLRHAPDAATRLQVTDRLAKALLVRGTAEDKQEAFDTAWQARSALLDTMARHPHRPVGDIPALMHEYRAVYELLIRLLMECGDEITLPADALPGTDQRSAQPLELAFDLHEEYKTWADGMGSILRNPDKPATLRALRAHLRTDADASRCAFVSYFCGTDASTIFVVHADSGRLCAVRAELTSATLQRAAQRLRRTFDGDADAFPPLPPLPARRPWRRGLDFFAQLAPGLLAFLPEVAVRELLCVAADGAVRALPLGALPLATRNEDGQGDEHVLASRHAVVQVTSATALLRTSERPAATGNTDVFVAGTAAREDPDAERLENDAEFVAPGCCRSEVTGLKATPDSVLAGLGAARIAHLSGHGWYDRVEPLDSGLFLAHDGQRPTKYPLTVEVGTRLEHLLTARRLARAELRLDLLTLRACSTARGDLHSTGDIQGLAQLLQHSGARTVVATLWDVDDASSRRLFEDFYRRLAENPAEPLWRALWQAQRTMLEHPTVPWECHPYHWAALALIGDWRRR